MRKKKQDNTKVEILNGSKPFSRSTGPYDYLISEGWQELRISAEAKLRSDMYNCDYVLTLEFFGTVVTWDNWTQCLNVSENGGNIKWNCDNELKSVETLNKIFKALSLSVSDFPGGKEVIYMIPPYVFLQIGSLLYKIKKYDTV